MTKKKCSLNTVHILRQIIRERDDPLSIFREAISNSKDANATEMKIIVEKTKDGTSNVTFYDNGTGMTISEICDFFNIGYSKKQRNQIGEKGLGTKLFFNSDQIIVNTSTKKNGKITGNIDNPMMHLKKGRIPDYKIEKNKFNLPGKYNTKIVLKNVRIPDERVIYWGNSLENYILWKTSAGSIEHYFSDTKNMNVKLEICYNNKKICSNINKHIFPNSTLTDNHENYAFRFDPFEFEIKIGKISSKVQIVGSIAGANAHIIRDKRIKKQFKGFFLCKDFFIVKDVNREMFGGGTGEWQNMHILVNCQDIELSMGREGFINIGEGTLFHQLIESIKIFKNCILKGQPFEFNGEIVEKGNNYAGFGYSKLKELKNSRAIKEIKCNRSLRLMQLNDSEKLTETQGAVMVFEPNNKISTYTLFLSLLYKNYFKDTFRIYDATIEEKDISILMKKMNGQKTKKPDFYAVEYMIDNNCLNNLKGKYQGIICWDTKDIKQEDLTSFNDIIILKDMKN